MLIQCTKSLLDQLGIKNSELYSPEGHEQFPNSFMAWHANLVSIDRKKAIVLMNNETRYSIVIYRPSKKDFSKINECIREAIITAFRMEGVRKEVIEAYLEKAGEMKFSKTASRSMLGKLNNAVREIEFTQEYLDEKIRIQRYISIVTGRFIQLSGNDPGFYPIEKMLKCLSLIYGKEDHEGVEDVLEIDLYQLNIKINLVGHGIWRRVLVPSTYSFRHLHNIIQTVFDWHDAHLHEFVVERAGKKDLKIVMDEDPEKMEYMNFDAFEIRQEQFVGLEEIFPTYGEVVYEYDFGDSWEHTITLENVLKSNEFRPTFVEGIGERPPEDVGGEGGYEDYLRIMADVNDPEHEDMKEWAENLKERNISQEKINHRLKQVIKGYHYSHFL
ncbi:plasmid pRiA4b ORF-3 family protein [Neobacillus niacini]|uniref:plasmid pRiA4b ORF-3 family protein n=1 Tax=Neobacillus niacini TaxID=86668 RepID=UPI00203F4D8E|nr:plasmid pRiA4b ORF-3 family protein [Neobacillus niacini]MCM3690927.1 plasmid pRiA4b ORF-3 family protein [Neobacillus niacini]